MPIPASYYIIIIQYLASLSWLHDITSLLNITISLRGIITITISWHNKWIGLHGHVIIFLYFIDFQFRNFKIVYRRYAGLYFCICVDISDNNLSYLEAIHNFVEVLNEYFHNVCELDLVFNFYKVSENNTDV